MRLIDETYLAHPYFGSRQMARWFRRQGYDVNRKRVQRLMEIEAIYQKPNLSRSNPAHRIYPYLLRKLKVERPNQCWATDITYVPIQGGYIYLCAVIDWYSRQVGAGPKFVLWHGRRPLHLTNSPQGLDRSWNLILRIHLPGRFSRPQVLNPAGQNNLGASPLAGDNSAMLKPMKIEATLKSNQIEIPDVLCTISLPLVHDGKVPIACSFTARDLRPMRLGSEFSLTATVARPWGDQTTGISGRSGLLAATHHRALFEQERGRRSARGSGGFHLHAFLSPRNCVGAW